MAKVKYDTPEEKQRLIDRAIALRPNVANVVATDKGWAVPQHNGTMELLVSFGKLDELLGSEEPVVEGEPLELHIEAPAAEEAHPEASEEPLEDAKEEVKVEPAKKGKPGGGRPAKKVEEQ